MTKRKSEKGAKRVEIDPAARDLVELAREGGIDFDEIKKPTRFKKYRINY
ncbi:hypothetical protein X802_08445 [Thermococcus guaymasensis DSM 11113]|uniref:Uncharacterized protein n=1 Tax=Thermococcus guaymasensis DSM 11113 TaxID=1432656 RepID=A0A0X1KNF8_9EURY|nr:hypothetical protein [Thermococcus guaymasensis]AJC72797.1 hypothetical protein X802_08445 [Thermococcus guaymasensis DSM 11113]